MHKCTVCHGTAIIEIIRNGLPLFECQTCRLAWRQTFDVDIAQYEEGDMCLGNANLERRTRNVKDRIACLERYLIPNDVCDIGAGEGMFLVELMKKGYTNVIGIEPNRGALAFGRAHGLTLFEGTLKEAPDIIRKNAIRIVTLFHVIEHLPNPRESVDSIYRALPSGGYLVVETPNSSAYSFVKTNHAHPLIYSQHLYYFNTDNLGRLLESVGFTIQARGKRGFDQYHMTIRQSLFCLGIGRPPFRTGVSITGENAHRGTEKSISGGGSLIRSLVRKTLSLFVVILGRGDYQWIIVRK